MSTVTYANLADPEDENYGILAPSEMFGSGLIRSGDAGFFQLEGGDDITLGFIGTGTGFVYDDKGRPIAGNATACEIRQDGVLLATITDIDVSAKQLRGLNSGEEYGDILGKIDATGSDGEDFIFGGKGADTLRGGDGNDTLAGGGGGNRILGGDGDDFIYLAKGQNVVDGGSGLDAVVLYDPLGGGNVTADLRVDLRETGFQKIGGGITIKLLSVETFGAGDGDDRLIGSVENNLLAGGLGSDTIIGGAGDDGVYLDFDQDDDVLKGGTGTDTLFLSSNDDHSAKVSLAADGAQKTGFGKDKISGFENVTGSYGDDKITGDAQANRLEGGEGDDTITGGGGVDLLDGGSGDDVFRFNAKSLGGSSNKVDIVNFEHGHDVMDLSAIDANANLAGNQDFIFIEQGAFTGVAGQLRWGFYGNDPSRDILVSGDANGDGTADLFIQLRAPITGLTAADFDF